MQEPNNNQENHHQVIKVLHLLKQASHDLHSTPPSSQLTDSASSSSSAASIKALLELETESNTILSHPNLSQLSHHLSYLKTLVDTLHSTRGHSLRSFLRRRLSVHQIARVAESIESELQSWIDREFLDSLTKALQGLETESELINMLTQFQDRVSKGFDRELQDLLLRSKIFSKLETVLTNPAHSEKLREEAGFAIEALIRFNKNVFVGEVLIGSTINSLISIRSTSSLRILCSLIKSIKSPLVDEIENHNQIQTIVSYMKSKEDSMEVIAFECVLEMGYYGRKEAVEAMMKAKVVEILVEMQRLEKGGELIELGKYGEEMESREEYMEWHPFASCVARFAVQVEVGEGLRQREKRAFKQEVLRRVRDASVSDAEAATLQAEVLWCSFP